MDKTRIFLAIALIFAIIIMPAMATTEIRGTVVEGTGTFVWTPQTFAGFQYDIDNNVSGESMTVNVVGRTISQNGLVYSTEKTLINKTNHPDYYVVGWMGDKYVAVGGKTNKIAKLVLDMKDDEKKTAVSGSTLNLGTGYVLKINSVDARASPRQVWFQLIKDNVVIDDAVSQDKATYRYTTTVLGDSDTLVFSIYVDSIFSGTEADMMQLKYGWLIDTSSAKEIKVGDNFGSMEVTSSGSDKVILTNKNSIGLSKNSEVTVMGNMKFKVANSDTLRFYPKIDVVGNDVTIGTTTPIIAPTVVSTPKPVVNNTNCTPTEKIVEVPIEKIVYVNVTSVPTVAPVVPKSPATPGFEGIFAIVGLLTVAFLVLRQRK
jgi:S-layer protein (TIGR01567 family)